MASDHCLGWQGRAPENHRLMEEADATSSGLSTRSRMSETLVLECKRDQGREK